MMRTHEMRARVVDLRRLQDDLRNTKSKLRKAKRLMKLVDPHLVSATWGEVEKEIWIRGYEFLMKEASRCGSTGSSQSTIGDASAS